MTNALRDAAAQTALDMKSTREVCTLDLSQITHFLHDGPTGWELHRNVVDIMSQDPVFNKSQRAFLTRSERYTRALEMSERLSQLKEKHNWSAEASTIALGLLDEQVPMLLHSVAFEPVLLSQGDPALVAKYGQLVATRGILGCYLQTELGHGTQVSSLETTATYHPDTKEFEIHSPTLTSRKWWIGALGRTSTHGVVQAQLILGGQNMGPHLFLVQLRSTDDHYPLPGITIGDIGPKAMGGFAPTDNGYAQFEKVRIPKSQMLSKFAQVTDRGEYVRPPHAKISYGGMLYIRSNMVQSAGWMMAKAATISIRYTTVRRQGAKSADGLEPQVISYPSVHYRLFPILARAYIFVQLGRNLTRSFDQMASQLATGDTSLLAELHALTSGLKVLISTTGVSDLETARRACGGHGYSAFAGLGRLYADYLPSTTYEGDNFVLDQQVVRSALKAYKRVVTESTTGSDTKLASSSRYLRLIRSKPCDLSDALWDDPETSIRLLELRAASMVKDRADHFTKPDASVDQRVSKAVAESFVAVEVGEMMGKLPFQRDSPEANAVVNLLHLYLLTAVETALVDLLSFGMLDQDSTRNLRVKISTLCKQLSPDVVGLSDAFGYTDWELDSALGVYDGRVYEALWSRAQDEPLNKYIVPNGYNEHIKPMLQRGQRLAQAKL